MKSKRRPLGRIPGCILCDKACKWASFSRPIPEGEGEQEKIPKAKELFGCNTARPFLALIFLA
jgi:hypothetical protein